MAKLRFKTAGQEERAVELTLGINRIGREPNNEIHIEDETVSGNHCELLLGGGEISVKDCGSTNGTFVDGRLVQQSTLHPGAILRVGDVELVLDSSDALVSIPKFHVPTAAPPIVLSNGSTLCRRHQASPAAYRCPHCHELLCEECTHRLRRRGGKMLLLCALCSYPVEAIGAKTKKKKSLIYLLRETSRVIWCRVTGRN